MSTTELLIKSLEFARARTLGLLDSIEKEPDPQAILAWRPGPGRAHIGWQLTHIAITEEIFATERLAPEKEAALEGTLAALSRRQHAGRRRALGRHDPRRIDGSPRALAGHASRNWRRPPRRNSRSPARTEAHGSRRVLLLAWHEAHHQGQAHLTLNLYKASR